MTGYQSKRAASNDLQNEILDIASKEMQEDIDKEILWNMLKGIGWHRIMLPRLIDNNHAIDISIWLKQYCQGAYERNGRDFIFENEKDFTMFALRWAS